MKFEKAHRKEPIEPQLATMIDVFSILIIFLIAGVTMDSSILNIPGELLLPETTSDSTPINAPQVTLKNGILDITFLGISVPLQDIKSENSNSNKYNKCISDLKSYLQSINTKEQSNLKLKVKLKDKDMLQSINLVADKSTKYEDLFLVMKFFRKLGFLNTILVGTENYQNKK